MMSIIKTLRKTKGLTQEDLAYLMGVKRSAVAMWESGKSLTATSKMIRLAKILNTTTDSLLKNLKA